MKTAVVLFNLGGPDSPRAVKPFLFNLFNDKSIINLPQPLRMMVAWLASNRRYISAQGIYDKMGGKSPILDYTRAQAQLLEKNLSKQEEEYKVFIAMRYWRPFIRETVADVKAFKPGKIILLPLYPQFSTTTTQSAFDAWYKEADKQQLHAKHHPICCYPFEQYFVEAHVQLIRPVVEEARRFGTPRILFCAHGLPEKIVRGGDPYAWQVGRTASAIMRSLGAVDNVICYQSKVGPLKWLEPSAESEIHRAAQDNVPIVIVPISFVSEHSETLVELDGDYRALAQRKQVPFYGRVSALNTNAHFIESLAWLCEAAKFYPNCSNSLGRQCPKEYGKCGFREWKE